MCAELGAGYKLQVTCLLSPTSPAIQFMLAENRIKESKPADNEQEKHHLQQLFKHWKEAFRRCIKKPVQCMYVCMRAG